MSIVGEQEELLFKVWEKNRKDFVRDGVVDPEAYEQSKPRIVFMLKEVNSPEAGNWDLRQYVRDGAQARTWDNVARWVKGIRSLPGDLAWHELEHIGPDSRRETLRSICAMNLKKSPGGHTTNNDELARIATEDRESLNKQFKLYDPDLVICCGSITSWSFWENIKFELAPESKTTARGVPFREIAKDKFVVEFLHPEARVPDYVKHYSLMDALREILLGRVPLGLPG